jgi:hypothetical protein
VNDRQTHSNSLPADIPGKFRVLIIPMNDISDRIQATVEKADESSLNSKIALCVALTATFMALCNVKDNNVVQAMSQAQAHGVDAWSYFQAKSTRQAIAENALDLLQAENKPGHQAMIHKYEEKIARYEKEKAEIKAQAEGFQKEYQDINVFDDQFDLTEAMLSIAIAMYGITALTKSKPLFYFACLLSGSGVILGLSAFMHISLHSEFISKILG